LASAGAARLLLDDRLLVVNTEPDHHYRQGATEVVAAVELQEGSSHRFVVEFSVDSGRHMIGLRLGARPRPPEDAVQRAVQLARAADAAIVVVGYDGGWEGEGADRPHMDLPGDQKLLIRAVAAANPRTIVVVNAGAPVTMPWVDDVAAILQLWFPGMEGGNALADVLFGDVDASGRLPTTFPRRLQDCPAYPNYPGRDGVVNYAEGLLVGYRHYDRRQVEPRFCFGHGLSYTRFEYSQLALEQIGDGLRVTVDVTNVGERSGAEVVQVYVRDPAAADDEPERELREFRKLRLEPGQTQTVTFDLPARAFAHWDVTRNGWTVAPGELDILVGSSSRDIRQTTRIILAKAVEESQ
jgi:beta-glucosidase